LLSVTVIILFQPAYAQKVSEKKVIKQLKTDISYLASDALAGRRTGSEGEKLAASYITKYYMAQGIPGYKNQYLYPFTFTVGRTSGQNTKIKINGKALKKNEEAFPL